MAKKYEKTFCNPISLINYPCLGKDWAFLKCFLPLTGRWKEEKETIFNAPFRTYRSIADPDVIYYDGKWYMYSSADIVYESEDMVNWHSHSLIPHRFDAEGVTKRGKELLPDEKKLFENYIAVTCRFYRGKFYMIRSGTNCIYVSCSPYGPFEKLGDIKTSDGQEFWIDDPALFVDDDDRLYLYFGSGVLSGIQGVELDSDNPCQTLGEPVRIVEFRPETGWECTGQRYQDITTGWIEGGNVIKYKGKYYLSYAANGTTYDSYNMGIYYSDSPLSGFKLQKREGPFCEKKYGVCKGAGHGCLVKGPEDTLWVFYTSVAAYTHMFERRIGMDKVLFDENGELYTKTTDYPQWAPGITSSEENDNDAGILPLNHQNPAWASSAAPGRDPIYVGDDSMITWWQPDEGDTVRSLIVDLRSDYDVSAARILWKEIGLDEDKGIVSRPIKYKIEITDNIKNDNSWITVVDESSNEEDYLNDYRTFDTVVANKARLTILDVPKGVEIGVISFIVFGKKNI